MRAFSILIAGAISSASAAAPVAHPARPSSVPHSVAPLANFEFKGFVAGSTIDPNGLGKCVTNENELQCYPADGSVAGLNATVPPSVYLYQGRVSSMVYLFDAGDFGTILAALTTKYGQPCERKTEKWQSQSGAVFDNPGIVWCFRTGRLTAEGMSADKTYGDLSYVDDWQAPGKAPKVDF